MDRKFFFIGGAVLFLLLFAACAPTASPTAVPQQQETPTAQPAEEATPTEEAPPEEEEARPPARGCLSCHALRDPETGKYTLAYEGAERAKARGLVHPDTAPDGTSIAATEEVGVAVCLQCHGRGTGDREGLGNIATRSLMDIIHPAHMFSAIFAEEFAGNCFSCHNVDSSGNFVVLDQAVEVNEKGVPQVVPIPGTLDRK